MYQILKGDERKNVNQNMTEYEDYSQLSLPPPPHSWSSMTQIHEI